MLGCRTRGQQEFVVAGSLRELIPDDHVLARVDRVLDLGWLRAEVAECYAAGSGRPEIDPEAAVRLMLAGLLLGIVHDRRLIREAAVNLAIRWFAGYGLTEVLPDHSSLTRIRQRWGAERFRRIFTRTVEACMAAGIAKGEVVPIDSSLVRADVSWEAIARKHAEAVEAANGPAEPVCRTDPDASLATNNRARRVEPALQAAHGGRRRGRRGARRGGHHRRAARHPGRRRPARRRPRHHRGISAGQAERRRELQAVERKIGNLVEVIEDGRRSPELLARLDELEARRAPSCGPDWPAPRRRSRPCI